MAATEAAFRLGVELGTVTALRLIQAPGGPDDLAECAAVSDLVIHCLSYDGLAPEAATDVDDDDVLRVAALVVEVCTGVDYTPPDVRAALREAWRWYKMRWR